MTIETRIFTPDMGEISGFGGGYEEACQKMMLVGLDHLSASPPVDKDHLTEQEWDKLRDVVGDSEDGCSGMMVGAASSHALYAFRSGWEAYQEKRREAHAKYVEEAPTRETAERERREQHVLIKRLRQKNRDAWVRSPNPTEEDAALLPWEGVHFYEGRWVAGAGSNVSETATDLTTLANVLRRRFEVEFNGHPLYAEPGEDGLAATSRWWGLMNAPREDAPVGVDFEEVE